MTESSTGRGITTIVVALSAVVMTLDISIVNVALPAIRQSLNASLGGAEWIVNAYVLAFAALLLTVGAVSDRTGRRGIFLTGHAVFGASSAAAALASSETILIVARGIQGLGAAMVFGTCLALLADAFGDDVAGRTRAIGAFMAAGAASAALGPLVGGALVSGLGWPWIFAINIPICIVVIAVTLIYVTPKTPHPQAESRIDIASSVAAVGGLFALNLAVLTGPDRGWLTTRVIVSFVVALVLLALLAIRQRQLGPRAMIDLSLFSIPTFTAATYLGFAVRIFSFGMMPFLTFWLAGVEKMSPLQIGTFLLSLAVPMIVSAPISVNLARRSSVRVLMTASMAVVAAGMAWAAAATSVSTAWTDLVGPLIVTGLGAGLSMPHLMDLALTVAPAGKAGVATGIANTAFPLGTAVGVGIYGAIIHAKVNSALAAPDSLRQFAYTADIGSLPEPFRDAAVHAYTDGLQWVFGISAAVALASAAVCSIAINPARDRHKPTSA